jgi:hypothetical protein
VSTGTSRIPGDGGGLATWRMGGAASTGGGRAGPLRSSSSGDTRPVWGFAGEDRGVGKDEGGRGIADTDGDGGGVNERLEGTKLAGRSDFSTPTASRDCAVAEVLDVGAGE